MAHWRLLKLFSIFRRSNQLVGSHHSSRYEVIKIFLFSQFSELFKQSPTTSLERSICFLNVLLAKFSGSKEFYLTVFLHIGSAWDLGVSLRGHLQGSSGLPPMSWWYSSCEFLILSLVEEVQLFIHVCWCKSSFFVPTNFLPPPTCSLISFASQMSERHLWNPSKFCPDELCSNASFITTLANTLFSYLTNSIRHQRVL